MNNMKKPRIRFKGFTDDWEQRKLGDLMDVGSVKRVHQSDWRDSGVRFLRARDVVADFNNEEPDDYLYIDQKMYEEYSAQSGKVQQGDLLVTGVGTIGIPMLIKSEKPLYFKDGNIIWFKNKNAIDGQFFYYSFISKGIQDFIKESAGIGTVGTYTIDSGKKTPINLPTSIEEQKKIGAFLESIDNVITLHQRKYDEIKEVKKYMLQKMFPKNGEKVPEIRFSGFTASWEQRKLGEVSDSYSGGTPTVGVKEYYGGQIPFIRSAEINSDCTELFITDDGLKNSSARLVSKGDILYALYGATSGEVGRARLNGAINQAILAIKPYSGYDYEFISQWLRKSKQSIIETYLQGGQGNLSGTIVKDLVVQFPTLPEQEVIGTYFANLDHLITLYQHKCDELKEVKKFMLQNMFPRRG